MDLRTIDISRLRLASAVVSVLLSVVFCGFDDLLNRDGYLYLFTADQFVEGGFSAAMAVYNWPFLSIVIAFVHMLTGLSIELSGRLLVTAVLTWLIDTLIRISFQLKNDIRMPMATALILLCSPFINEYRSELIRDPFAWAFVFYGMYSLFCYVRTGSMVSSCVAQVSFMLAVLFRVEAIIFLLLPTISIFLCEKKNGNVFYKFVHANSLFATCAIIGGSIVALYAEDFLSDGKLIQQIGQYLSADFVFGNIGGHLSFLQNSFLPPWSDDYALGFLISGLCFVLAAKTISGFNVIYFLIFAFLRKKRCLDINGRQKLILLAFSVMSLIPITWFMMNQLFVSTRYAGFLILLGFLVMGVLYGLEMVASPSGKTVKVVSVLLCLLLIRELVGIDQNKMNYVQAGAWVKENIAKECGFLASDSRIGYLAGRGYLSTVQRLPEKTVRDDYQGCSVVVVVDGDDKLQTYASDHDAELVKSFDSGHRKVDVYRINGS